MCVCVCVCVTSLLSACRQCHRVNTPAHLHGRADRRGRERPHRPDPQAHERGVLQHQCRGPAGQEPKLIPFCFHVTEKLLLLLRTL